MRSLSITIFKILAIRTLYYTKEHLDPRFPTLTTKNYKDMLLFAKLSEICYKSSNICHKLF